MTRLFTDNATTTLSSGISAGATSLSVANGSVFPALVTPDHFIVTLTQSGTETSWEDVKVTARSGNTLTCLPTVGAWGSGSKVEIRWNAVAAIDAANVAQAGSAILDFGEDPSNFATVTIIDQDDIKSSSMVDAYIPAEASADHTLVEHVIVPIQVRCGNIVPGVSFDIYAFSPTTVTGRYNVNWIRTL